MIGDEAWDVDYFLHENPELKRFSFAWMTDFVGLAADAGPGEREALLTADYNAEMLEQRARFRRIRDRQVFVGNPEDVVDESVRPRPAQHPGVDGRPTTTSPATSPGSSPRRPRRWRGRARAGVRRR